jgi:hypothetical protein
MPNDFYVDSLLAQGAYRSNNQSNTPVIAGWTPIKVDGFTATDPSFGAQLYEKNGLYKIVYRGTENNLPDWITNLKYGGNFLWSNEFEDTVVFATRALKQIADAENFPFPENVRHRFSTTGHSQGGFEAQLSSALLNIPGTSIDGMGTFGTIANFNARFDQILRNNGVVTTPLGGYSDIDFVTRIYTAVGRIGIHKGSTELTPFFTLSALGAAVTLPIGFGAVSVGIIGANTGVVHPISRIVEWEAARRNVNPILRQLSETGIGETPLSIAQGIGSLVYGNTVPVGGVAGSEVLLKQQMQQRVEEFMQSFPGAQISVRANTELVIIEGPNGAILALNKDGSGVVIKPPTSGSGSITTNNYIGFSLVSQSSLQSSLQENGNTLVTNTTTTFAANGSGQQETRQIVSELAPSGAVISQTLFEYGLSGNLLRASTITTNTSGQLVLEVRSPSGELTTQVTLQTFDDGTKIRTTETLSGLRLIESLSENSQITGSIRDTPLTDGTTLRLVTTTVNGVEVVLTQENSLSSPNTFTTTAIEVDGQGAVSMEAFAALIDSRYADPLDFIRAATQTPADLRGVVTAADASNTTGLSELNSATVIDTPWVNSASAQGLQAGLSITQALITSLQTRKPLPVATAVFNYLASNATGEFAESMRAVNTGLGWVNSYLNLRGALAREDGLATFQAGMGLTRRESANDEFLYESAA